MWSEFRLCYRILFSSARTRIIDVLDEDQARRYRELLEREAERHDGYRDGDGEDREGDEDAGSSPSPGGGR